MLKIDKLKKQYKNFTLNCSMEVKEGMITGFVGPNGSGKSTTLKAVLGLIYIDGGDIQIFGKNVKDIKPEDKEQIGVVLSDSGFSRYLTVKDIKDILKNTYEAFDEQLFTNYIEKYHRQKTRTVFCWNESKIKVNYSNLPQSKTINLR